MLLLRGSSGNFGRQIIKIFVPVVPQGFAKGSVCGCIAKRKFVELRVVCKNLTLQYLSVVPLLSLMPLVQDFALLCGPNKFPYCFNLRPDIFSFLYNLPCSLNNKWLAMFGFRTREVTYEVFLQLIRDFMIVIMYM